MLIRSKQPKLPRGVFTAILTGITAFTPALAFATTASSAHSKTILIGATLPLTGSEAREGNFYKEGYETAFHLANKDGGVTVDGQKYKVRLKLLDDRTKQEDAINLAQELITRDHVNFMLGTYSTPLVEAQSTVAERDQIPYVNGGGGAAAIYKRGYKWIFGDIAPISEISQTDMKWIAKEQAAGKLPKPATIATLWENTAHGRGYERGLKEYLKAHPGTGRIVVSESFPLNSEDFSSDLNKVASSHADLFLVDAHQPDFFTMQKEYVSRHMCNQVVTYSAHGTEPAARSQLGLKNVDYIVSASWWNSQLATKRTKKLSVNEKLNRQFLREFHKLYGSSKTPGWPQALSYEAARSLFAAIHAAGSLNKNAVRIALTKQHMASILPGGVLSYPKSTGYQAHYTMVLLQNHRDGKAPIVFPASAATGKSIAPNPCTWNK